MREAVWKTLKVSKTKKARSRKGTTRSKRSRRRSQRGGNYDVPSGLGGTVTGRMGDEIDSLNVTRSMPLDDKQV